MTENNLISLVLESRHCEGKKAKLTAYDQTGWQMAICTCGKEYLHDNGAIGQALGKKPTEEITIEEIKNYSDNYYCIPLAMFES
ncbi:hypothetical protein J4468_00855 [Candidatus Woesearchaeota archaeon]|nr:hypothetical protein [Candidatus Woesearchaeota archaeon]